MRKKIQNYTNYYIYDNGDVLNIKTEKILKGSIGENGYKYYRLSENGNKKMSVSLATSERYRDRDGNWVEQTEWHNLVAFGFLAQDIADKKRNYFKGDQVYVEGRIKTRQYVDNQNVTRSITEINVDKMMSLGNARNSQNPNASYMAYSQQSPQFPPQPSQPQYQQSVGQPSQPYQPQYHQSVEQPSQPYQPQYHQSVEQPPQPSQTQYQQPFQQPVEPQFPNSAYDGDDLPF